MTAEEIQAMAKEAGFMAGIDHGFAQAVSISLICPELARFAAMVAAKEREAIKTLCFELGGTTDFDRSTCLYLADKISAPGGK